jgi:predicted AlkP superfamily pyrophosphatase or phosphodiesterase
MRNFRYAVLLTALSAFGVAMSCIRTRPAVALVPSVAPDTEVAPDTTAASTQQASSAKLVVFITVDQLRGDYPGKWGSEIRRGLKRLIDGGAYFTNGFQDHAITETAPGHASTMSGRFPSGTGIASNSIGVVDPNYKLVGGAPREAGASPFRFRGTTLYDWLVAKDRRAKAFSVSMKDRGAILPIGRAQQQVYWYSSNGSFVTSDYYRASLPKWVEDFNDRRIPFSYAGSAWTLSRDNATYKEVDDVKYERGGANNVFPHLYPASETGVTNALRATPGMDSLTALFALEGLRQLNIGRGSQTDVMAVSFSASDYVGHTYGPDSREVHENFLRLDETLGWFIDSLYKLRDSASIVIALTADHGVSPIPELARERGEATGDQGLRVDLSQHVNDARARMQAAGVNPEALLFDNELVGIDRKEFAKSKLNPDSVLSVFANAARKVQGVARVDLMADVRKADPNADPIARRWKHQVPLNFNVEMVITLTRYTYWGSGSGATHGSPYDQDAFVPILFYGAGINTGKFTTFARTVDMAPTLAALLNVKPTEKLDGVVLTEAIRK